ncbi:MAG: transporter, partial [Muribaculaceae bacterium]|nr:transporter [Muribaculaceae bacterium]
MSRISVIRQRIKPWMLPIAMVVGVLFHESIGHVAFLSRYLIFTMLLITYCRLRTDDLRIGRYIWLLLAAQVGGAIGVYALLRPFDEILAQGAFICVFCPTATAAPVITGMLGGSVGRVAVYSLFSHMAVALLAPVCLAFMGDGSAAIPFGDSLLAIARSVLPLILGPLAIAALMGRFAPKPKAG